MNDEKKTGNGLPDSAVKFAQYVANRTIDFIMTNIGEVIGEIIEAQVSYAKELDKSGKHEEAWDAVHRAEGMAMVKSLLLEEDIVTIDINSLDLSHVEIDRDGSHVQ